MSLAPFFGLRDAQLFIYYLAPKARPPGLSELISVASLLTRAALWHHWTGRRRGGQGGLSAGMMGLGSPRCSNMLGHGIRGARALLYGWGV